MVILFNITPGSSAVSISQLRGVEYIIRILALGSTLGRSIVEMGCPGVMIGDQSDDTYLGLSPCSQLFLRCPFSAS